MSRSKNPRWNHGTYRCYEDGCRCEFCTTRHNEQVRRSRRKRLADGRLNHGTRSAYDAGCRCEDCRAARRSAYRRLGSEWPGRRAGEQAS